jgi:hypothetical protein
MQDGLIGQSAQAIRAATGGLIRAAVAGTTSYLSSGVVDGQTLVDGASGGQGASPGGPSLGKLQEEFATLVERVVRSSSEHPQNRFIIFVDDLDRIRPEKAVSLLEVLKNFMEVKNCVFVLACDYEVIRQGVRLKFGIEDDEKARAFFDKIIQVPFQMPVSQYWS